MKTKTAPAMQVVVYELRTTLKKLIADVGEIPTEITKVAVSNNLHPTGPQYWIYQWLSQDMESEFVLKICLPVATFGNSFTHDVFKLEKLLPFKCASKMHYGAWDKLSGSYNVLMQEITEQKLVSGSVSREVYINCDFENLGNNITEIQFEVQ